MKEQLNLFPPESLPSSPGMLPFPRHVALAMDGNGRWARARGLSRQEGHAEGAVVLRRIVAHAAQEGLSFLTLYSFSSENWGRPPEEVGHLMELLRRFVSEDLETLCSKNIRICVIGRRDNLSDSVRALLQQAEERSASGTGMTLLIAFNYGGRDEILRAVQRIGESIAAKRLSPAELTEESFAQMLDTASFPDPDLIIRTGRECRLSNFLLWQAAYAELLFLPMCWPDFNEAVFDQAIQAYRNRERRYGRVGKDAVDSEG